MAGTNTNRELHFMTMTLTEALQQLQTSLAPLYDRRESENIAWLVLEKVTNGSRMEMVLNRHRPLTEIEIQTCADYEQELRRQRPVQYVLGEAWFAGMPFYVDEHVLIPRPETEELVDWVVKELVHLPGKISAIDIGTGSGCIAIALKKKLPRAGIMAIDASEGALAVAQKNAVALHIDVQFSTIDFLSPEQRNTLPQVHLIVSNPPYIPEQEKAAMAQHVVGFEPAQALFVSNDDPLIFYKAISEFATSKLLPGGWIFVEISENAGQACVKLFEEKGWKVELKKDLQERDRMLMAHK